MNNWDKKRKQKEKREEGNAALRYETYIIENWLLWKMRCN